jgi:hypothetical protein
MLEWWQVAEIRPANGLLHCAWRLTRLFVLIVRAVAKLAARFGS